MIANRYNKYKHKPVLTNILDTINDKLNSLFETLEINIKRGSIMAISQALW